MVSTEEFRQHQLRELPRAAAFEDHVSDPARAQYNRLARDRIVADQVARAARSLGIRVIDIDGARDAQAVAEIIADCFAPYLPPPEHRTT